MPFSLLDSKWTVGPAGSNDQENKGLLNIMFTVPHEIYQGLEGIALSQTKKSILWTVNLLWNCHHN